MLAIEYHQSYNITVSLSTLLINQMNKSTKTFIGGIVLGTILGAIIGGFAVAVVGATAFINYELAKDKQIITRTK